MVRDILLTEKFKELIETNSIYADKTNLVKDILKRKVVLYTRPRRFGKTLNMSMLYYFFSNQEDSFNLFKNLNIAKDAEAMKHLNKYPVISITLKELSKENIEDQITKYQDIMSEYVTNNSYLLESDKLTDAEKKQLIEYRDKCSNRMKLESSLKDISGMLYRHFGSEVIILIDEYDAPLRYAQQYDYYDKMLSFIRPLFSSALKTNDYLYKGVMTGCLRIAKESVFTGLNNFETDGIFNNNKEVYFGFTENEVKAILNEYNMPDKYKDIKDLYDGYLFGDKEVYNPWSTLKYIKEADSEDYKEPVSYWANTSGNGIIYDFLKKSKDLRDDFRKLLDGKTVEADIYPEMTYRELGEKRMAYSYLLTTGYLKATKHLGKNKYELMIPNKEVGQIYENYFTKYADDLKESCSHELCLSLIEGNPLKASRILNTYMLKSLSYHNYTEAEYHTLLIGLLSELDVFSEKEMGLGRPDIYLTKDEKAICLELKKADSIKNLEKYADKAIEQIKEKKYVEGLYVQGFEDIKAYGISFFGKECCIKKL